MSLRVKLERYNAPSGCDRMIACTAVAVSHAFFASPVRLFSGREQARVPASVSPPATGHALVRDRRSCAVQIRVLLALRAARAVCRRPSLLCVVTFPDPVAICHFSGSRRLSLCLLSAGAAASQQRYRTSRPIAFEGAR